ncbi:hypothetical protein AS850_02745 [Frondihabitans sp. 762G35]|uniref:hypothetical protein n=1 Tax=Frondihabitans sp. 762G35 TaxID=1446794 RepID=UPI000D2277BD|nr:hypothetical protein [Frondihabitans sp. 762G35]ARC55991.1 hypothetical protein AS850_02745 [Frondihabitans sp. 762G35]
MTERERWIRYESTKRPVTVAGGAASSTDPDTWSSYGQAKASTAGVGLGFVLGDGIGCIDLDHCLMDGLPDAAAARFLKGFAGHYIEVSPSGDGLHIWGTCDERPGTRRHEGELSVERYSTGRYITVTGRVFQNGALLPL